MLSTWVSLSTTSTWKGRPNGDKVCIIFTLACRAKCTFQCPFYTLSSFSAFFSLSLSFPALYTFQFLYFTNIYLLYRKRILLIHYICMYNILEIYTPSSQSLKPSHTCRFPLLFSCLIFSEGLVDSWLFIGGWVKISSQKNGRELINDCTAEKMFLLLLEALSIYSCLWKIAVPTRSKTKGF